MNRTIITIAAALVATHGSLSSAAGFEVNVGAVITYQPSGGGKIDGIIPGGLAEQFLQENDLIIAVDEIPVNQTQDAATINNRDLPNGHILRVIYQRGTTYRAAAKAVNLAPGMDVLNYVPKSTRYGIGDSLTLLFGAVLETSAGEPGAKLVTITSQSGWAAKCMQVGDRLVAVDGIPVNNADDIEQVKNLKCNNGRILRVIFHRGNSFRFVKVKATQVGDDILYSLED